MPRAVCIRNFNFCWIVVVEIHKHTEQSIGTSREHTILNSYENECVSALSSPYSGYDPGGAFQTQRLSGQGRQPADSKSLTGPVNYIHYDKKGDQLAVRSKSVSCILGALAYLLQKTSKPKNYHFFNILICVFAGTGPGLSLSDTAKYT